jgi:adenine-specific DNA-methyltransferase
MEKGFFKQVNTILSSDIHQVNRVIVSTFLSLNDLKPICSKLISTLTIDPDDNDWDLYNEFKNYFVSYQTRFSFEDLIEIFELIVSPSDKKVNGAIYTPDNIKSYIINEVTKNSGANLSESLVCDVACGCGGFLYSYAQFLHKESGILYETIFKDLIYGVDIALYSIERSAITLSLLAIKEGEDADFQFNLKEGNSLDFDWRNEFTKVGERNGFDFVLGNPPYVCAKNISSESRLLLEKWPVSLSGNPDLYIPFFQVGLEALNERGVLGYITVNSFTRSMNGRKLREYFHEKSFGISIVDFGGEQVFKGRTTYTCICIIERQPKTFIRYCLSSSMQLPDINPKSFTHIPYKALLDKQGWSLSSTSIQSVLHNLRTSGIPLAQVADIRGGFATLKNSIFLFKVLEENITHFKLKTKSNKVYWIEKGICRDAVKANSLKKEEDIVGYSEKIIFPYKYQELPQPPTLFTESKLINRRVVPLQEDELIRLYPGAYKYLNDHREDLSMRDKGGAKNYSNWYIFGRAQGLDVQGYKLLFPHISDRPYFVYTENKDILFYNGFSIVSWSSRTLKILQKILNSELFWFFVKHTSKPYSGDYFGLGKNYIKDFSIPSLSISEEDFLLNCSNSEEITAFLADKYSVPLHMVSSKALVTS